jgi:hypothetical protein
MKIVAQNIGPDVSPMVSMFERLGVWINMAMTPKGQNFNPHVCPTKVGTIQKLVLW